VASGNPVELSLDTATGRVALAATVAASAMTLLDATVVNVALPQIGQDLGGDVSGLQWVLTGYLLALASLILLAGAVGDRYGRRRTFLAGTVWFAGASLLCALAPTMTVLVVARVLQGVGAALLTPGSLAILQSGFREVDRARAVGAWSGLGGVAGAIGPLVGGWLVGGPGWRWVFLLNLPVAALVVVCTMAAVPESRDPDASGGFDTRGAVLAVVTLGTATWALTAAGSRGWSDPVVVAGLLVAALGGVWFVRHLLRATDPLVPPSLFASRPFTVTNLATVFLYSAIGVSFFVIAYELQVAAGWSPIAAGTALLPATILMFLFSARSGALAARIGPRAQLTIGPLLFASGLLLLTRIGPDAAWLSDVFPGAAVLGLGLVTFVAPLTATVMGSVTANHVSVASGVNNAVARTATLVALAVVPVVSGFATAATDAELTTAFRTTLVIAAALAAIAAPLSFAGLAKRTRTTRSARHRYCPVDGPPLQPDPERCPAGAVTQAATLRRRAERAESTTTTTTATLQEDTMADLCTHLDTAVDDVEPSGDGCVECLRTGGVWVHLRLCMTCGHVGCCDNSPGRHATAHWREHPDHPLLRSFEPGEDWWWCYVDDLAFEVDGAPPAPSHS
jgi:EmrB/QacA subfamily drug resistance transporter